MCLKKVRKDLAKQIQAYIISLSAYTIIKHLNLPYSINLLDSLVVRGFCQYLLASVSLMAYTLQSEDLKKRSVAHRYFIYM